MQVHGTVFRYKSDVDTDVIIPARYLNTTSEAELASHCMEDIDKDFVKKVIAIKASGISLVIANSFARIFYRNSINIGLPILECPEAVKNIKAGDVVSCDLSKGEIVNETTGQKFQAEPFPEFIQNIIDKGGLIASIKAGK